MSRGLSASLRLQMPSINVAEAGPGTGLECPGAGSKQGVRLEPAQATIMVAACDFEQTPIESLHRPAMLWPTCWSAKQVFSSA